MLKVAIRVGRLIELRCVAPLLPEEVEAGARELVRLVSGLAGQAVGCVDLRRSGLLQREGAARFIEVMRRDNPKIERNAFILPDTKATLELQMERIIREAGSASRRLFHDVEEAERWLGEVLSREERRSLSTFLDDVDSGPNAAPVRPLK